LDDAPRLDADRRLLDLDPVDRLVCRLDCTLLRLIDVRDAGLGLDLALEGLQGIETLVAQIVGCLRGIELRRDRRDVASIRWRTGSRRFVTRAVLTPSTVWISDSASLIRPRVRRRRGCL
jgi:hypothetical protein